MNRIVKPVLFDYSTNKYLLEELVKEYPFLKAEICGKTVLGRGIFSLSVGSVHNSVIYVGGFSGDDGISPLLLYMFIEDLCKCIKTKCHLCSVDMSRALSQLGVTVIPCINPDGRQINLYGPESTRSLRKFLLKNGCDDWSLWCANAKGVDIRRNFSPAFAFMNTKSAEKGIMGPCKQGFCGEYAESESETKTLTRLCRIRSFRQCMTVEAKGESLSFTTGPNELPESDIMSKIIAQSCFYNSENGYSEDNCGFPLWFSTEFSRPAFLLKAGRSSDTYNEADEIYERIKEALTVFSLM